MQRALLAIALFLGSASPAITAEFTIGAFAPGSLAAWQTKSFKGETQYRLVGHGNHRILEASCNATASAIALRKPIDLTKTPILRWQWRVPQVHDGLDGSTKTGDDYAARVYVIHDGGVLAWRTRAVNYVWANTQPRGKHWPNAFTDKAMMVALESGDPPDPETWKSESRDVRKDFERFYGLQLQTVAGVALMTDCDNSAGSARAYYRNIRFTSE